MPFTKVKSRTDRRAIGKRQKEGIHERIPCRTQFSANATKSLLDCEKERRKDKATTHGHDNKLKICSSNKIVCFLMAFINQVNIWICHRDIPSNPVASSKNARDEHNYYSVDDTENCNPVGQLTRARDWQEGSPQNGDTESIRTRLRWFPFWQRLTYRTERLPTSGPTGRLDHHAVSVQR